MEKTKLKQMIENDEDFINAPRYQNSLKKALADKDEFTDKQIAQMLMIEEKEVEILFQSAIIKIRQNLRIGE